MYQSTIELDTEARRLYEQIARISAGRRELPPLPKLEFKGLDAAALEIYKNLEVCEVNAESFADEQLRLNKWRIKMVDFAHTLSGFLNAHRLGNAESADQTGMDQLMNILDVLAEIPSRDNDKKMVIRHRGINLNPDGTGISHSTDYVISAGNVMIDKTMLTYLVKAQILQSPDLITMLDEAFKFFSLARIHIVELSIKKWRQQDRERTRNLLCLWGEYLKNCRTESASVICGPDGTPDPNLSLLAGLNRIRKDQFQDLVTKIDGMMTREATRKKFGSAKSVYEAMFLIDSLKSKLTKPTLEINNSRHIRMWRKCFDENGHFNRSRFNRYRPEFFNWENAFYLFWMDLKSVAVNEDRITLLNCIVKFIKDSNMINEYLEYILKDFFYYPLHLHFSDVSSLVFSNMLLLKNFMDKDYDFGRTPEEVLKACEEKNDQVVRRLQTRISNEWSDRFYEKLKTIEKNLKSAIKSHNNEFKALSIHFLVNLLREAFIFLTLIDSVIVQKTLRDTVEKYGNSRSDMYHSVNSADAMTDIFTLLQTAVRCLVAFGDRDDIGLLKTIKVREEDFLNLRKGFLQNTVNHRHSVKKLMTVVEEGIQRLSADMNPC